ncbi:MAG: tellurite resistance methyltransferase TehB [Proteobacteria bacterium]|nr:MAG: tellurite resistance methyltransferase TehB [Pseudomonadota bacterium]
MKNLRVYKRMPEWSAATLPAGFRRKHNTKEGTWAQLTVNTGALRLSHLDADGAELSSHVVDAAAGPQLVAPGAWHKVEPLDDALRCQLAFLCEPGRYLEKKYGLTAPHSDVRALLPTLEAAPGRSVLDLGSGRGRNSFLLAEHGFTVTAVDRSDKAIATLRQIQADEGYSLCSSLYDINQASLASVIERGAVDHIICTVVFQFLQADRLHAVIDDMQAVTRPAGLHLIVAPLTSAEVPCPIAFPGLLKPGELRDRYRGWELLRYDEALGEFHRRDENGERYRAEFVTLIARKPGMSG